DRRGVRPAPKDHGERAGPARRPPGRRRPDARRVRRRRPGPGGVPHARAVRVPGGSGHVERLIRREAHAKINHYLRVLGRRADGYHDIESLVLPVSLADTITVRLDAELRLAVRGELADEVPLDESNLVIKAARALASAAGVDLG